MPKAPSSLREFQALVEIAAALRGPDGCPWDKEQTHVSLTPYAVEETAELVEVIEMADDPKIREELGDVLFQVALHAQLAKERGAFDIHDVLETLNAKMIRRHPHVFGDVKAETSGDVVANWEQIKKSESGGQKKDPLDAPAHLPALQRSAKIGFRTRKLKFDWENADQVWNKVREEIAELEEAYDDDSDEAIEHELGDVLFSLAQFARHLNKDPEQILRAANRRFERRFGTMLKLAADRNLNWDILTNDEKESLWSEAKKLEKAAAGTLSTGNR